MKDNVINIAIDGPSSAGKSTLAKMIASKLNIAYLDTGSMYRSLAYYFISNNIDIYNEEEVAKNLNKINFDLKKQGCGFELLINNENIEDKIRNQKIAMAASDISKQNEVRKKLVELQQKLASKNNIVLDGRDITSVVLKDTKFKFYLDANYKSRALRRFNELKNKGENVLLEEVEKDIQKRDINDLTRKISPLVRTPDSFYIDNSNLNQDETLNKVLEIIKNLKEENNCEI